MSSEITLDEDLTDPDKLRPIPWLLNETVAPRIKKAGIAGGGGTLKLKTANFRILTRARRLNTPTQSAEEMFRAAQPLLSREADGRAFRLIGIGAHDLIEADRVVQADLFGRVAPSEDGVDKALDAVRDRFGEDAIDRGRGFEARLVRHESSKGVSRPAPQPTAPLLPPLAMTRGLTRYTERRPLRPYPPYGGCHAPTGKREPPDRVAGQSMVGHAAPR